MVFYTLGLCSIKVYVSSAIGSRCDAGRRIDVWSWSQQLMWATLSISEFPSLVRHCAGGRLSAEASWLPLLLQSQFLFGGPDALLLQARFVAEAPDLIFQILALVLELIFFLGGLLDLGPIVPEPHARSRMKYVPLHFHLQNNQFQFLALLLEGHVFPFELFFVVAFLPQLLLLMLPPVVSCWSGQGWG